jgi:hypothetical protein
VGLVVALLIVGEFAAFGLLEGDGDGVGFTFVAEIAQDGSVLAGPCGGVARISVCARNAVVSCLRLGRTSEVHNGQPSGAVMTWMVPPWLACLPDHHRSTPVVGPGLRHRSVAISVPSMLMWARPVEEPPDDQDRLRERAQRPGAGAGAPPEAFGPQQVGQEQHRPPGRLRRSDTGAW